VIAWAYEYVCSRERSAACSGMCWDSSASSIGGGVKRIILGIELSDLWCCSIALMILKRLLLYVSRGT
jgi:hypothetical protein